MKATLKAIRVNNGWSQEEAAKLYGISVATLQNYELGKTFPDVPTINRIIEVTGISYNDIIFLPNNNAKSVLQKEEKVLRIKNQSCIFNKNGLQIKKKQN